MKYQPLNMPVVAFLLLMLPSSGWAQNNGNAAVPTLPTNVPATGTIPAAQALFEIAQKHKVNVVADAVPGETVSSQRSLWLMATPEESIQEFANQTRRKVMKIEGVYVLQRVFWAEIYKEIDGGTFTGTWSGGGTAVVTRRDEPEVAEVGMPATLIDVAAREISTERFVKVLRENAALDIRVAPPINTRRVNIYLTKVSPSVLISCMAYLLNAGPQVTLRQTSGQKAWEEVAATYNTEHMKRHIFQSNKLRPYLEKLLTDAQRDQLAKGEVILFNIGSLPPDAQARALEYAKWIVNDLTNNKSLQKLDLVSSSHVGDLKTFDLEVMPLNRSADGIIGVVIKMKGGGLGEIHY